MGYDTSIIANANTLHYYPLDEVALLVANDQKGFINGALTGGVTRNQPGLVDGQPSMFFDGVSGQVTFSDILVPSDGGLGWTIDFWFMALSFGGTLFKTSDTTEVYLSNTGELRMTRPDISLPYAVAGTIELNTWYYCNSCYNGVHDLGIQFNDLDGTPHGGGSGAMSPATGSTSIIGNGAHGFFHGYIQKVASSNYPCGHSNFSLFVQHGTITAGQCVNPYEFDATQILDISTDRRCMSATTHRKSRYANTEVELWYNRDSTWHLFPVQPLNGPTEGLTLTQQYKQPYTLEFTLPDPQGLYAPENRNSAYNYRGTTYDPLLDEARKIVLRAGTHCYSNLAAGIVPTSSQAPSAGPLSVLTDQNLGDISNSISGYVQFLLAGSMTLTVDLGSSQQVRHAAIRFATYIGIGSGIDLTLPASVQVSLSADNVTYTDWPKRPVGGEGSLTADPGDWADSHSGQTPEFAFTDLDRTARYVKFTIVLATNGQTIAIDELAIYGGKQYQVYGCNLFTGYLGDAIEFTPSGHIKCLAVDVLKKLADNNDTFLTAAYRLTSAGGIELADIAYSLLTATAYWKSESDYDSPFPNNFIGWSSGSALTGLQYPLWQGQSNNLLGYEQELWGVIGWNFYADGNGAVQSTEPPYTQRLPNRVCVAAPDGCYDGFDCNRHRTGKQMRNSVIVQSGTSKSSGSGTISLFEPNSISRYGRRTTRITNPLASTTALRQKVAAFFLRDYAWNLQTLSNTIRPDYATKLKHIFAFRAPARPNLYARTSTKATDLRAQELWSLVTLTHTITFGQWTAAAEWIPYFVQGPTAPTFEQLNAVGGHNDQLNAVYDVVLAATNPTVSTYNLYLSSTGEFGAFSLIQSGINPFGTPPDMATVNIAGLVNGNEYWIYMTSVDIEGNESIPSVILAAIAGSSSQSLSCYTITDFSVSSILTSGPDSSGYYTYQFLGLWTAPLCGFTQSQVRAFVGPAPPSNPDSMSSWPLHDDSWDFWAPDRIASGRTWNNVDFGQLPFTFTFRSTSNLSGDRIYFRIWNSARTRSWRPVSGNFDFCTIM